MERKEVSIEDLARMVQKGFEETAKANDINLRFGEVDERFDEMDKRFDKIENILITDHQRRIERLESKVEELRDLLAVK